MLQNFHKYFHNFRILHADVGVNGRVSDGGMCGAEVISVKNLNRIC